MSKYENKTYFFRLCTSKLKLKPNNVSVVDDYLLQVLVDKNKHGHCLNFSLQQLAQQLPNVIVKGLNQVSRAVIAYDDTKTPPT